MNEEVRFTELDANLFRAPDGYFETFTERMMSKLPMDTKRAKVVRMRWWQSVAAVAVFAVSFVAGWMMREPVQVIVEKPMSPEITADMEFTDAELDMAVDYELVKNSDVTYYLMVE